MHAREASRIDPMQNPKRPGYFMNYAQDETPAEMVLRKLACWLGVGGYNAPTVDADLFHDKIVAGINYLVESASSPQSPPVVEGAVGDKTPGSDWHLTLLMAPYHLNLVVGSDRQHLLAWGRDVWRAALSAHGVYDDDGHFAVSFEGFQPIPQGDGAGYAEPVTVGAFVEPGDWHPSVRAAIDAAMSKEQPIHEARPDDRKEQT
jgi:hypothetical protein